VICSFDLSRLKLLVLDTSAVENQCRKLETLKRIE